MYLHKDIIEDTETGQQYRVIYDRATGTYIFQPILEFMIQGIAEQVFGEEYADIISWLPTNRPPETQPPLCFKLLYRKPVSICIISA